MNKSFLLQDSIQDNMQYNTQDSIQEPIFPLRLQVFLAKAGVCSRRVAEKLIAQGKVAINGKIITTQGTKVQKLDQVFLEGSCVVLKKQKPLYVLLNKPSGYICSMKGQEIKQQKNTCDSVYDTNDGTYDCNSTNDTEYYTNKRPLAVDLVSPIYKTRLFNVGRLDMFSSGLIIFTNDGNFAKIISHPSSQIEKEYIIDTVETIPKDLPQKFTKGIRINGIMYKCKSAAIITPHRMAAVLVEGKNREIRNVFKFTKLTIRRLTRCRIGNIKKDTLQTGKTRLLTQKEVSSLLELARQGAKNNALKQEC